MSAARLDMARLRAMFVEEATGRVAALTEGLLRLERGTADAAVMELLLRQTHSLKGSAGLVGMAEVGTVAHQMEDVLQAVADGTTPPSPQTIDGLLAQADEIESLLRTAGTPVPEPSPAPAVAPPAVEAPPIAAPAVEAPADERPAAPEPAARLPVALDRLDEIVRLSGQVRAGLAQLRERLEGPTLDADLPVLRELERTAQLLQRHAAAARTVPVLSVAARLQRAVRDAARTRGVQVTWALEGGEVELDRSVLAALEEALLHVVRNSVAHGIEPPEDRVRDGKPAEGRVALEARARGGVVQLAVVDDGRGLDREALLAAARRRGGEVADDAPWVDLVFASGVSTAAAVDELAGRGVGMDVVTAALRRVGGSAVVTSTPGAGTRIQLEVPLTLAVARCLEVTAAGGRYALPLRSVVTALDDRTRVSLADGRPTVAVGDRAVPVLDLAGVVGAPPLHGGPLVVLRHGQGQVAVRVGALVHQAELTVQALPPGLPPVPGAIGTAIAGDGTVVVVLDPDALDLEAAAEAVVDDPSGGRPSVHVLVVDDALTIRELQRSVLERAGYRVTTAADGREALDVLDQHPVDLVITDVEMPRMDGYALTEAIRRTPGLTTTPVLILTTLDDEADRRRGLEAGADGYLLKRDVTAESLLDAVAARIGPA